MTIWAVVWVVLMCLWLFGVGYWTWEPGRPYAIGGVIIPWLCVLILGLILLGGLPAGTVVVR